MTRLAITAVQCALACSVAFAQTAEAPKPPEAPKPAAAKPAPEIPPELKALNDARRETDPEKKIAALEKWKLEYPSSSARASADVTILNTLATKLPKQEDRIRNHAAQMYKSAETKNKGSIAYSVATELLNANLLLKQAEKYGKRSLDAMVLGRYMQEQLDGYEKRKQTPPAPEELKKRFDTSRASRLALLGRVEVKLGQTEKGKKLLEESYAADANNVTVQSELGVLAAKAGDDRKAAEYLIPAKLSGRPTREAAEAFEAVYKKQHNGSVDGLEALLDAEYNKRYPNPIKLDRYVPTEKRSDRVVLAEVFTGSGCGPCAAADLAFDAAMERYSRKDLAVIMYHVHIPRPDPMTSTETLAIQKLYAVNGVPSFLIDGKSMLGGGSREMAKGVYDRFAEDIRKGLETPAEAHITAGASVKGNTVSVNTRIHGVKSDSKDLKVKIALVEKELRYNGENGVRYHPMVLRAIKTFDLAGESYQHAFDIAAAGKAIKDHLDDYESKGHRGETFKFSEKKYAIDRDHLAVVIFVHDEKTKHVLQAGFIDLAGDAPHPTLEANNAR
jgi:thiol-disulfide isomerase/thioredoxin